MWYSASCKAEGKSFWAARYHAGDEVWECDYDWSLMPRQGLIEVRLHCPDGSVGVLGNTVSLDERAWQLKTAMVQVGLGRQLLNQVIGVHDPETNTSVTYTWDYEDKQLIGPYTTITPQLNFDVVGIKG